MRTVRNTLAAGAVAGTLLLGPPGLTPAHGQDQEQQHEYGESAVVELGDAAELTAPQAVDEFTRATVTYGAVTEQARQDLDAAIEAYDRNPSTEAEARLARVDAEVKKGQLFALGSIITKGQVSIGLIDGALDDMVETAGTFDAHRDTALRHREEAGEQIARLDELLDEVAVQLAHLVGPDGLLADPDLENAVDLTDHALSWQQAERALAEDELEDIDGDDKERRQLARQMRRVRGQIAAAVQVAIGKREMLGYVAAAQQRDLERRKRLNDGKAIVDRAGHIDLDALGQPLVYMRGTSRDGRPIEVDTSNSERVVGILQERAERHAGRSEERETRPHAVPVSGNAGEGG